MKNHLVLLAGGDKVKVNPDTSWLPGVPILQNVTDGVAGVGLVIALLGLLVAGCMIGIGHLTSNRELAGRGKVGLMGSVAAAVIIGAASIIINFAYGAGGTA